MMKAFLLLCLLVVATYQTNISSTTGFITLDAKAVGTGSAGALDLISGTTTAASLATAGFSVSLPLTIDDGIVKTATGKALAIQADKDLKVASTGKTAITATAATSVFTFTVGTTLQGTVYPANFTAPTALITSAVWSAASKDMTLTAKDDVAVEAATGKWAEFRFAATVYQRLGATSLEQLEGALKVVGKDDVTFKPSADAVITLSSQDGTKSVKINNAGVTVTPATAIAGVSTGDGVVAPAGKDLLIIGTGGVSVSTTTGNIAINGNLVDQTTKGFTAGAGKDLVLKAPANFAVRARSGTADSLVSATGVVTVTGPDVVHKTAGLTVQSGTTGDLTLATSNAAAKVTFAVGTVTVAEAEKTKITFGPATGTSTTTVGGAATLGGALNVSGTTTLTAQGSIDDAKKISGDSFTVETTGATLTLSAGGAKKVVLASGTTAVVTAVAAGVTVDKDLTTGTGLTTLTQAANFDENITFSGATVTGAGALTIEAAAAAANDVTLNGKTAINIKAANTAALDLTATGFTTPGAITTTFTGAFKTAGKVTFSQAATFTTLNFSTAGKKFTSTQALEFVGTNTVVESVSKTDALTIKAGSVEAFTATEAVSTFKLPLNTSNKLELGDVTVGTSTQDFTISNPAALTVNAVGDLFFEAPGTLDIKAANVSVITATGSLVTIGVPYSGPIDFSTRAVTTNGKVTLSAINTQNAQPLKINATGDLAMTPAAGSNLSLVGLTTSDIIGTVGGGQVFKLNVAAPSTIDKIAEVTGAVTVTAKTAEFGAAAKFDGVVTLVGTAKISLGAGTVKGAATQALNYSTTDTAAAANIDFAFAAGKTGVFTAGSTAVITVDDNSMKFSGITTGKVLKIGQSTSPGNVMKIRFASIGGALTDLTMAKVANEALCKDGGTNLTGTGGVIVGSTSGQSVFFTTLAASSAGNVRICAIDTAAAGTGGTVNSAVKHHFRLVE